MDDGSRKRIYCARDAVATSLGRVELLPQVLIVGAFSPALAQAQGAISNASTLTRTFEKLAGAHGLLNLQIGSDSSGAVMAGPNTTLTIDPPLLRVQQIVTLTVSKAADDVTSIIRGALQSLTGEDQLSQLGVRLICHAPAPSGTTAGMFVLEGLLRKGEGDFDELMPVGMLPWVGVKFRLPVGGGVGTLTLEPLLADSQLLFIDLDVQFTENSTVANLKERIETVESYVRTSLSPYLGRHEAGE